MMGRISESVTAVAPSEIRPKVFLGCIPQILLLVAGAASGTASSGLLGGLVGSTASRTAGSGLLSGLVAGATGRTASSGLLGGLVGSAAGRATGGRLLGGLVSSAASGTAGSGLLGRLIGSATGRTAGSGLLSGLVGSTASRSRGGSRLFVPAKEIRKSHNCYLQIIFSGRFAPCVFIVPEPYFRHKYAQYCGMVTSG